MMVWSASVPPNTGCRRVQGDTLYVSAMGWAVGWCSWAAYAKCKSHLLRGKWDDGHPHALRFEGGCRGERADCFAPAKNLQPTTYNLQPTTYNLQPKAPHPQKTKSQKRAVHFVAAWKPKTTPKKNHQKPKKSRKPKPKRFATLPQKPQL